MSWVNHPPWDWVRGTRDPVIGWMLNTTGLPSPTSLTRCVRTSTSNATWNHTARILE